MEKAIAFFFGNAVDGLRGGFVATDLPSRREYASRVLLKGLLKRRRALECLRYRIVRVQPLWKESTRRRAEIR